MISEGQPYYLSAPHLVIYPGLAIMITVLAFNLVGDGLRDAFDPQQRQKMTTPRTGWGRPRRKA